MTSAIGAARRSALRRPRALGMLGAALLVVGLTYVSSGLHPSASLGTRPASSDPANRPAVALPGEPADQPAIGSLEQIDHSIHAWTINLAANSKDFISATNLAVLDHARGRLTGDLDDQTRALDAVRTAEAAAPTVSAAVSVEASIEYTLHDFSRAFAIADRLYRANSSDLGSLATRADAELELGRTALARADYEVVAHAAPGPAVDVRLARLAYLTGDPAGALARATSARDASAADPDADHGFYDYAVGEYARLLGDDTTARAAYVAALAIRPTDFASLVGLAKVDAAEGHIDAAMAGLKSAAAIVPQPETLILLGDLEALSGNTAAAHAQYATVRAIRQLSAVSGTVFDRQLIGFELDHDGATEALLATTEADLSTRTDAAGYDLAAWAAYRLGQLGLAQQYIDAALATGIRDGRMLEHAGAIALARGDRAHGDGLLREALGLGPALDPLSTAETLRLLAA
jgi:tetratricopeptide (TPR) repeat protein